MSKSHRGEWFQALFSDLTSGLRKLLKIPISHHIFFVSSGTECMERIIENTVAKYSLHFVNGAFSKRFYKTAKDLGKSPQNIEVPLGKSFDFNKIKIPKNSEVICLTHNETSTGVMLSLHEVYKLKRKYPEKLIALDVVSSIPYVDVDYDLVDMVFFSVQKGFGLPAGLGVMIVSPEAFKKSSLLKTKAVVTGSYHSFADLSKYESRKETPETPNVLDMFLLCNVIKDMQKIGIKKIRKLIDNRSKLLEKTVESSQFSYLVKDGRFRSKTIHVFRDKKDNSQLMQFLEKKHLIVSRGYGELKESFIRLGNFPAHSDSQFRSLISALNEYLKR